MNILLVYATNSGTTQAIAQIVSDALTQQGHTVTIKEAAHAAPEDFASAQAVILGSPSWDFDGKEGQPHEDFLPLMDKMKGQQVAKPFAIFGLGDTSYKYFCGAVDHLEEFVKTLQGNLLVPSLRIANYYTNLDQATQAVNTWITTLGEKIKQPTT